MVFQCTYARSLHFTPNSGARRISAPPPQYQHPPIHRGGPHAPGRAGRSGAAGGWWYRRGRRRQGLSQQRDDGRAGRPRASQLRVGAGSRATPLEGQAVGARLCMATGVEFGAPEGNACCVSAANGWSARTPISTRWGHAPSVSARACQHPEAPSGAGLRPQSRPLRAQGDGRGTPRSLQGRVDALVAALIAALNGLWRLVAGFRAPISLGSPDPVRIRRETWLHQLGPVVLHRRHSATGC